MYLLKTLQWMKLRTKEEWHNMEERILNAISIAELLTLRKEVLATAYSDEDSEYLLAMIEDMIENFK